MKTKEIITNVLEGMGLPAPSKRLLTSRHKVRIMEELLLMEPTKVLNVLKTPSQPIFVLAVARLIKEHKLGEYFDVLEKCRQWEREEKEANRGFLK